LERRRVRLAIGNRIQVVTKRPITTDHVRLVQKQNGPQDRWITQVRMTFDDGNPVVTNLDATSRVVAGSDRPLPERTFSKLSIEITNTSDGPRILNGGAAAVGFGEIDLRNEDGKPVRVHDIERMPLDLLAPRLGFAVAPTGARDDPPASASRAAAYRRRDQDRERVHVADGAHVLVDGHGPAHVERARRRHRHCARPAARIEGRRRRPSP